MNEHSSEIKSGALARLREIRDVLGEDGAPRRVNLRDYVEPGSATWEAFVDASGLPGHKVRRGTMLARINQAIDALTAELIGLEPRPASAAPVSASPPQSLPTAGERDRLVVEMPGGPRPIERQRLRRLTPEGIQRARDFLADMRAHPDKPPQPPRTLLLSEHNAQPFPGDVEIERRSFRTRREAAEYLAPQLEPVRRLVADHPGVWSWLGMFYFPEVVRVTDGAVQLSPQDETFVVDSGDPRSLQTRYMHYLWSSWRLHDQHGESVAFVLDQELTSFTRITRRILSSIDIFNSIGIVPLILRLYTDAGQQKAGFSVGRGNLDHLARVIRQLERTYDVYGMEPDALLRILPDEFRAWDGGSGPDR